MTGLARRIADFVGGFSWDGLSGARRRKTRWIVADFVACVAAGSRLDEAASGLVLARDGDVLVPGVDRGLAPDSAMIAMGTLGALLQIHDGYGRGGNHPCSSVVPAAWVAGGEGAVEALLAAVAAGYEVANRLAGASHPAQSKAGSAPTSTMGAIGAAAAIGKLQGMAGPALARAIGNAAFYAPIAAYGGLREHGSAVPLHGGMAARAGWEAVRLAEAGLDAGDHVLEGEGSFLALLHGDAAALTPESWCGETLDGIYFKPLPACRHVHPALEALLALLRDGAPDPAAVTAVEVDTYRMALVFAAAPRPGGALYDRLMSLPWVLASAIAHGGYGVDNLREREDGPEIERLVGAVAARPDDGFEAEYPRCLSARVTLALADGSRRSAECALRYGEPSEAGPYSPVGSTTPVLDEAGMRAKFLALTRGVLPDPPAFLARIMDD